ncbi:hypothetical protein ACTZWW_21745 [Salinarimonas sp. NSM]|uniref:hypothetical protein n=1 Tax=Salinarimonas sp. NSM TaxID=3458003 RepID=UPI00403512D8
MRGGRSTILFRPIDAFARWVRPVERLLIVLGTVSATILALVYLGEILGTYPTCGEDEPCPYRVPVWVADGRPTIFLREGRLELAAIADFGQFAMQDLRQAGMSGTLLDPMMASGFLVALLALWLSLPLERLFGDMIRQLDHDQILPIAPGALSYIELRRRRWAWSTALVVATVMLLGIVSAFSGVFAGDEEIAFLLGSTLLGALAGHRLGTAAAYGAFARHVRTRLATVRLLPGHADKMGGWRRLGEFVAYEAVLMLVPIIWLSTWLFVSFQHPGSFLTCWRGPGATGWPDLLTFGCADLAYDEYMAWVIPQFAFLLIALTVLYLGFLRPFYAIARAYRQARAALRDRYDTVLLEPLKRAVERLRHASDLEREQEAIGEIGKLTELREQVWTMPPVPLRTLATGVFSLSAFYPAITLLLAVLLPEGTSIGVVLKRMLDLFKAVGV